MSYTIEVETLDIPPSITYPLPEVATPEWTDLATVPQLETDQAELQEARELVNLALRYYRNVRITESLPGGERRIVR